MLQLRELHERYGHIQEIIIQNFRAKPETKMAGFPEPALGEHLWTVAVARLVFGPDMNIQAPPNLSPGALRQLVAAGINDWGGVSPVTPDYVNPERPWPQLELLTRETAKAGKVLVERLAIYPSFVRRADIWLGAELQPAVVRASDGEGFARTDRWIPGTLNNPASEPSTALVRNEIDAVLTRAIAGVTLSESNIVKLFESRGDASTSSARRPTRCARGTLRR